MRCLASLTLAMFIMNGAILMNATAKPTLKASEAPQSPLTPAQLNQSLQALSAQLKGATVTWLVEDLKSGVVYASALPDQLMHPASTNKLATTAVALDTLGAQFRYRTRLWVSPPLPEPSNSPTVQETLEVDPSKTNKPKDEPARPSPVTLYWEASGDSKVTREVFQGWAKTLKQKGLGPVEALVIDDHLFTDQPLAPGYERAPDDDAAYRAAAGAVGYDFNRLVVRVRPGAEGKAPKVSLVPPIPSVVIENHAMTTRVGKEQLTIRAKELDQERVLVEVSGSIPRLNQKKETFKGISVARRAPFPVRFSGEALLITLKQAGLTLSSDVSVRRGALPPKKERSLLLEHRSPKLKRLLHDINTYSNNFMAEQTLLTLGLHKQGFGGWAEGVSVIHSALKGRFKLSGFQYVNGSGLFGEAGFSARQLSALLRRANQLSRGVFAQTLPRSRREGTIKRRFKELPKGAVRAKTGTLDGVSTLCGYLETRERQRLSFCVMMAGFAKEKLKEARATQDQMVSAMWRLKNPNPSKAKRAPRTPKPKVTTPKRKTKPKAQRSPSPKQQPTRAKR